MTLPGASWGQMQMLFSSDSLVNITSPLDLDSLFYWFAADVGVTDSLGGAIANNEGVGTWNDLSGRGHHVTQSTNGARPVWKATGGPGSKPCIQFDGSNDFLASAAHWWGSDDLTVIVVMKFANATRDAVESVVQKFESSGNHRQWRFYGLNAASSYVHKLRLHNDGGVTNSKEGDFLQKSTNWRVLSVLNSAATTTAFVDGSSQSVTELTSGTGDGTIYNSSTANLSIAAVNTLSTPTAFLQGSISEVIVYSRALTTGERTALENYLNKKYDLY